MEAILKEFTNYGFPGLIIAAMLFWIWRKDAELKSERDARVLDAKDFREVLISYQEKHLTAITHLTQIAGNMKEGTEEIRESNQLFRDYLNRSPRR